MTNATRHSTPVPPEQQAIRDKCFHPSGTFVEFPMEDVETSIPARFEKIVRLYPDRLAVKMGDRALTYEQLNQSANRLARAILEKRGPGSEPIALLFDHGIDVIAAILGVLKAGKFFVALDPSFPRERMNLILEDSQAKLVLTNNRNWSYGFQPSNAYALVNVNAIDTNVACENLGLAINPTTISSILYTSGSTGTPKGVIDTHRNILESTRLLAQRVNLTSDDRLTLLHQLTYASARTNFYLSLLHGALLCPFEPRSEGMEHFADWLNLEQISILYAPVAFFRQFAEMHAQQIGLPSLRVLHLSGAPITQSDFEHYKKCFHDGVLLEISMGSTEARSIAGALLNKQFTFPKQGSPAGYAPPGKTILILDAAHRELPRGEVGEIAVKGRNLNPGYWRLPDLAKEKYLEDPEGGGEKLYLTGDLGLILADGFLIHLGRKDLMVKIRGYRIDLSEVERALLEHPGIKEAGAWAWDRDSGEKYLAGYVVPREQAAPNVSGLREYLRLKLPDYMIPSVFVFLKGLPLTNGKLDRNALPRPDHKRLRLRREYVSPSTETEKKISRIWSELLDLDQVGVHDNFFDLGGHSLAATRLISRVIQSFRVEVSLKSLFESPTLADFAQRVEDALHQAQSDTFFPLISVPRGRPLPTSFGQRSLWFHEQLEPGSCAYNLLAFAYHLSGALDVKALEQSVNQIVDRHEVLRSVFEAVDGQPLQTILPAMKIELPIVDLGYAASETDREIEIGRIASTLAGQSFDLARGPLLRTALLRLASDEHVLLMAAHHVVFDGWSMGVFANELSQIYNSLKSGQPSLLRPLSIQYADFAAWERRRLQGVRVESLLSYWRHQLDGLAALKLPGRRRQSVPGNTSGAHEKFQLSQELSAELRNLSDRTGTTLFMVLLAAYKIALHRYTGQTDIAIGSPTAGRHHPGVEGLIGFFLNMMVLRTDLSGNPTFRELLERVRRVCLDAFVHQDLPFEKLVEELRPTRDLTHNPLIQVTFALQNTPTCSLSLTGLTARELDISGGAAKSFDLHLFLEDASSLRGYVSYNQDLFEGATIRRLIGHLQNLLEGIVANPDQNIGDVPLLTAAEKHRLLVEWNGTGKDVPGKRIDALFEAQVERSPDAVAVGWEDQELTYGELNRLANQLAQYLRKLGVGPGSLVAICVERSLEMVVGLLGILKAGAAYVPLDPDYPEERLAFVLEDTQAPVLLTQARLIEKLPSLHARLVCLDRDWPQIGEERAENPENKGTVDETAYVIYTSGTTGQPKGVMISHHNVSRLFRATDPWFQFTKDDVWTMFHSYAFDFSVWELWGALLSGGKAVIVPWLSRSPEAFYELLYREKVTVLSQTPSAFRQLMGVDQAAGHERKLSLRSVILGGEPLDFQSLLPWFDRHGDERPRLINMYGITETTVHVTYRVVRAADIKPGIGSLIGVPIPDLKLYVLDKNRQLVPIGVPGELYVGGAGVGRGYLNRPDLTAERFIANPFEKAGYLYNSGDLVRRLSDGDIEYLGRADDQIKIRGFRIEPGEIEAVLLQHPEVREAVVLAREEMARPESGVKPTEKRLVAYVVPRLGDDPIRDLRNFLKAKLPDYMVPSAWVYLDKLPLMPNGKIDRRALPAPDGTRPGLEQTFVAPRTSAEKSLAGIWAEMLRLDRVGIHDNFFDLGGHSLLATQVISRLRDTFQVELPLRSLFESPTVGSLAAQIVESLAKQAPAEEMASVLAELESLSEEEAGRLAAIRPVAGRL